MNGHQIPNAFHGIVRHISVCLYAEHENPRGENQVDRLRLKNSYLHGQVHARAEAVELRTVLVLIITAF